MVSEGLKRVNSFPRQLVDNKTHAFGKYDSQLLGVNADK
jgi:hypothetical protein